MQILKLKSSNDNTTKQSTEIHDNTTKQSTEIHDNTTQQFTGTHDTTTVSTSSTFLNYLEEKYNDVDDCDLYNIFL